MRQSTARGTAVLKQRQDKKNIMAREHAEAHEARLKEERRRQKVDLHEEARKIGEKHTQENKKRHEEKYNKDQAERHHQKTQLHSEARSIGKSRVRDTQPHSTPVSPIKPYAQAEKKAINTPKTRPDYIGSEYRSMDNPKSVGVPRGMQNKQEDHGLGSMKRMHEENIAKHGLSRMKELHEKKPRTGTLASIREKARSTSEALGKYREEERKKPLPARKPGKLERFRVTADERLKKYRE